MMDYYASARAYFISKFLFSRLKTTNIRQVSRVLPRHTFVIAIFLGSRARFNQPYNLISSRLNLHNLRQ